MSGRLSSRTRYPTLPEALCFLRALHPSPPCIWASVLRGAPQLELCSQYRPHRLGLSPTGLPLLQMPAENGSPGHLHFSLVPLDSLERITELRKALYSGLQFSTKDTNEQPDGETHRVRSGRTPRQELLFPLQRCSPTPHGYAHQSRSSLSLLVSEFLLKFHCAGMTDEIIGLS